MDNPDDSTRVSLIFANVNEQDILLKDKLDELAAKHKGKFNLFYVLNNPPTSGWKGGVGFVNKEIIKQHCPAPADDIKVLLCGPPPMIKAMQTNLEEMGYEQARALSKIEDQIFKF